MGTKTRLRDGSTAITDHALAAPVFAALPFFQVSAPIACPSCGIGSQVHFSLPVAASKARTSPLAWSVEPLTDTPYPTIIKFALTAGGDLSSYSANSCGGNRRRFRRSITPLSPNSLHGVPVRASSEISRASMVAKSFHSGIGHSRNAAEATAVSESETGKTPIDRIAPENLPCLLKL